MPEMAHALEIKNRLQMISKEPVCWLDEVCQFVSDVVKADGAPVTTMA